PRVLRPLSLHAALPISALVVGEQRALHPLDHLVACRQAVAVDLEADVLLGVAEVLEEQRVLLGREDGAPGTRVPAKRITKRRLRSEEHTSELQSLRQLV